MKIRNIFKLGDLYVIYMAIVALENANKTLPFKLSWKLEDIKESVRKDAKRFETEKKAFLEQFGTPAENNNYTFTEANKVLYRDAVEDLHNIQVDLEIESLDLSFLESIPSLQIPPGVLGVFKTHLIREKEKVDLV
jgi:hypothetical protein